MNTTLSASFCFGVLNIALMFSCQHSLKSDAQNHPPPQFTIVRQPDFFAPYEDDTVSAAGEKWFKKGQLYLENGDTANTKKCYQEALKSGYPVSRYYLMPAGL